MIPIVALVWAGSLFCAAVGGEEAFGISKLRDMPERTYEEWCERVVAKNFCENAEVKAGFFAWQEKRAEWRAETDFKNFEYQSDGLKIGASLVHSKEVSLLDASKKHPLYVIVRDGKGTHNEFNPLHMGTMWQMAQRGFIAIGSHYRGGEFSEGEDQYYEEGAARDVALLVALASTWPAVDRERVVLEGHMRGAMVALQVDRMASNPFSAIMVYSPIFDLYKMMHELEEETEETVVWRKFFGMHGDPEPLAEHGQAYKDLSPISWPEEIKSPLLIINGAKNPHCVTARQITPFLEALKRIGNMTRVEFHEYPDLGYFRLNKGCTPENPMGGESTQRLLAFLNVHKR